MIQEMKQFIPKLKGMNFQVQEAQCPAQWVKDGAHMKAQFVHEIWTPVTRRRSEKLSEK